MECFICCRCNQQVKKDHVATHCCCTILSCMDCGTQYWRDDNCKTYTECITIDEKNSTPKAKNSKKVPKNSTPKVKNSKKVPKNSTQKASANKKKVEQNKWIKHIKNTIATSDSSGDLAKILQRLKKLQNIPREKSKFKKFFKHNLNVENPKLISETWDIVAHSTQNESTSNERNGTRASVKRPAEPLEEDESSNKKLCSDQGSDKFNNSFDVHKACKKVLDKFPEGIPKKQLKKEVIAEYQAACKSLLKRKIKEVLKRSSFTVNSVS